jgi:hypothetical protein
VKREDKDTGSLSLLERERESIVCVTAVNQKIINLQSTLSALHFTTLQPTGHILVTSSSLADRDGGSIQEGWAGVRVRQPWHSRFQYSSIPEWSSVSSAVPPCAGSRSAKGMLGDQLAQGRRLAISEVDLLSLDTKECSL